MAACMGWCDQLAIAACGLRSLAVAGKMSVSIVDYCIAPECLWMVQQRSPSNIYDAFTFSFGHRTGLLYLCAVEVWNV